MADLAHSVRSRRFDKRLIGAWVGSLPVIVPAIVWYLIQRFVPNLPRGEMNGLLFGLQTTLHKIGTMADKLGVLSILAGPVLHILGFVCWLALLCDDSINAKTKASTGVCLLLASSLTFWFWYSFFHIRD